MTFENPYLKFFYSQFFVPPPPPPKGFSLEGKTGIITGANSGLGLAAAQQVLELGLSHLIIAVRSVAKGEATREKLLKALPEKIKAQSPTIEVQVLELDSYDSILKFVNDLKQKDVRIDFAILNAAVQPDTFALNPSTSNENCFQTNWLSTGLLAVLLFAFFRDQAERLGTSPTLSIVGSEVANWAANREPQQAMEKNETIISTLNIPELFSSFDRYSTSKLLLLMLFRELCDRASNVPHGKDVVLNLVNPGLCYGTGLQRDAGNPIIGWIGAIMKRIIGRSTPSGARTLVHGGAIAGQETNGKYLSDCTIDTMAPFVYTEQGQKQQRQAWEEFKSAVASKADIEKVIAEGF